MPNKRKFNRSGLIIAAMGAIVVLSGCKVNINEPTTSKPPSASSASTTGGTSSTDSTTGSQTTSTTGATTGTTSATAGTTSGTSDAATGGKETTKPASATSGTSGSTTGSTPSATTGSSSSSSSTETDLEKQPGYNPDRVYQLSQLKTAPLDINGQKLTCWIADTESTRDEGLMSVKDKDIKDDQGMIFAFPQAKEQGFYMKHTYIPLDIAFIGADKKVVSTATMQPFNESNVPSHGAAMYVLEMKQGTLARLGIQKGMTLDIPASVKAQDPAPAAPPGPGGFGG